MTQIVYLSSQRETDDEIVDEKLKARDFRVQYSEVGVHEGVLLRLVVDGHHSYRAACEAGVDPEWEEAEWATQEDSGETLEEVLAKRYLWDEWYDIETGWDYF